MKLKHLFIAALTLAIFTSCSNDDDSTPTPRGDYENGILIVNEGNFGGGNASVSFVSNDLVNFENNIFENVNADLLGDTAQSMAFNGDLAYIIVNVSNKIEVVNRYTFESVATIDSGLSNPRYMTVVNGKGYVTNWGDFSDTSDDELVVIDLTTNSVTGSIPTNYLPERLVAIGNKIYVNTGTFGFGNLVDVFDASSDTFVTSITVGNDPNSLQIDNSGDLWVLSSESLVQINTSNDTVTKTLPDTSGTLSYLSFDDNKLYYYSAGSVYEVETSAAILPTSSIVDGLNFYDMSVNAGSIYGVDALDFASNGNLEVYDVATGVEIESFTLSIIPGEIYFN